MIGRKHSLAHCEICPLQKERCAPTTGPSNAKVAVVSRSPGVADVTNGSPFSGVSGEILDYFLNQYGYNRKNTLVTNLVLCYSDDPPKAAIDACRLRLYSEIENIPTIIAAGAEAVRELVGPITLSKARGIEHKRLRAHNRVVATNNPAAVIYDSDSFPNLVDDFKLALDPPAPYVEPEVYIRDTEKDGRLTLEALMDYDGIIATDVEGHSPHLECIGFALGSTHADVLTRRALLANWDLFKKLMESHKHWIWHNGLYDVKLLRQNDIRTRIVDDTYPLSYVLDERTSGVHGLKYLARNMLGWGNYETALVDDYMETGILPDDATELYYYNGKDCVATFQLYHILKKKAEKDEVYDLYKTHYVPLMNALVDVELRGFEYDVIAAANLNEEIILPELRRLKDEMRAIVGQSLFNPASTLQVNSFVYDRCGLKHSLKSTRKRSFVRSFSDPVRTEITEGRFSCKSNYKESLIKFTELLDSFSEINKQRGTYIEGLIKLVKDDGRLYCSFNPCGTVTGRLSSRTPNFQNITRTERNVVPAIRTLFKPTAGSVLIQADYSQAELRCIARFSGDSELLSIYRDTARSLHRETASAFYGEHYTKEEYVKSKNINFGVCYGQSAFGFAQMYHMPEEEAQAYIDTWFAKFPQVRKWISQVHDQIKRDNYLTSPFGFKRRFHLLTRENLQEILKQGVNFLPQNTAGMLTAAALVRLNQLGVEVISTVHDSIIADVPYEDAMATAQCMKEVMESQAVISLGWDDIPFKVDISMSDSSWGEVEEVEVEIDY